jgi:galactose-1-phosphate uridylyltransferase
LIKQELGRKSGVIADFDGFLAVAPFAARFPFETWILPKKHCCDFTVRMPNLGDTGACAQDGSFKLKMG